MNVEIRLAEISDAEAIAKVQNSGWQNAYAGLIPDLVLQNLSLEARRKSWEESIKTPPAGSQILLACIEGEVQGFMGFGPSRDEEGLCKCGEIYTFYVNLEYQNRGLGKALMKAGLNFLKAEGHSEIQLWAIEGNTLAQNWYESRGWKNEGVTRLAIWPTFEFNEIRLPLLF